MVAIDCDTAVAYLALLDESDARPTQPRSEHELFRVYFNDCVAVAYNGKVLPQGRNPHRIAEIIARLPKQQERLL